MIVPQLPYSLVEEEGEPQVHGLRLSASCPAKRIIDYFESDDRFNRGVGQRGNDMAAMFIEKCLPKRYTVSEYAVPWGGRWTGHVDALVDNPMDARHGPWELKSHIDSTTPSAGEIDQLSNYLCALWRDEATKGRYKQGFLAIVSPSDYRIYGPFVVELTLDKLNAYDKMLEDTAEFMANLPEGELRDDPRIAAMCTCGRCALPATDAIDADDHPALREALFVANMLKQEGAPTDEVEEAREVLRGMLNPGQSAVSKELGLRVALSRPNPREKVDWKGALAGGHLPPNIMDKLKAANFVTTAEPKPTLTLRPV